MSKKLQDKIPAKSLNIEPRQKKITHLPMLRIDNDGSGSI